MNRGGISPDNIADLGPEVATWASQYRVRILCFCENEPTHREGEHPLEAIPTVPDLVCMADLPPEGQSHDAHIATERPSIAVHMTRAFGQQTKRCWTESQHARRRTVVSWQRSRCGWEVLGCVQPVRCAPAAYWASGVTLLHDQSANSTRGREVVRRFSHEEIFEGCLGELRAAASELDRKGFWWRPSRPELHEGKRPANRPSTREGGHIPELLTSRRCRNVGSLCCTRLGASVDADARHNMRSRFRRIAVGTK